MRIYVASGLENREQARALMSRIREAGHVITYDWTEHGSVEADGTERYIEVAISERWGVLFAEGLIVLLPGGRGTHTELGIAIGVGTPIAILNASTEPPVCVFHFLPEIRRFEGPAEDNLDQALSWLAARRCC